MFADQKILSLTDAAKERIRELMDKCDDDGVIGLRVSISNKGCSGHAYKIDYAYEAREFEEEVKEDGVCVLIDPAAVMFLIGSTIDYKVGRFESGFEFINPNETSRCGCGESFSV